MIAVRSIAFLLIARGAEQPDDTELHGRRALPAVHLDCTTVSGTVGALLRL